MTNPEDIRELKKIDNSYQIQKYSSYSLEELFTVEPYLKEFAPNINLEDARNLLIYSDSHIYPELPIFIYRASVFDKLSNSCKKLMIYLYGTREEFIKSKKTKEYKYKDIENQIIFYDNSSGIIRDRIIQLKYIKQLLNKTEEIDEKKGDIDIYIFDLLCELIKNKIL